MKLGSYIKGGIFNRPNRKLFDLMREANGDLSGNLSDLALYICRYVCLFEHSF